MSSEKVKEVTSQIDQAIEHLARSLEAGQSDAIRAYFETVARFYKYSLGNQILIAIQRPDATCVAGFRSWQKFNRYVKKGERGIRILAPIIYREQDSENLEDTGEKVICGFRVVYVFDVSQTDGEPLPEIARAHGDPGSYLEHMREVITTRGITLTYVPGLDVEGRSRGGAIDIKAGLPPAEDLTTMIHELAHEILHKGERRKQTTKVMRETEAEAIAGVVGMALGLDAGKATVEYIQLYNGDIETFRMSLEDIRTTAADILSALNQ